jgi:thiamine-monophosphate kinase
MELEFIHWLCREFAPDSSVIGDDAAVLDWSQHQDCVVATDLLADGVHFQLEEVGAELAGRKGLAVNLSDMASMAAQPIAAVVSLLLPRTGAAEIARSAMLGMRPLAQQFQVLIAGGDTNVWDGRFVINVTILGTTAHRAPWTRRGMQPGDWLLATGEFGGSRQGRHLSFTPRVQEAIELASRFDIHAAIDVSDGLSLDASRLASASGCGVILDRQTIPISAAAQATLPTDPLSASRKTPLEHALYDGEDFELLMALDERVAREVLAHPIPGLRLSVIGRASKEPGLWLTDEEGIPRPMTPRGYEHGANP